MRRGGGKLGAELVLRAPMDMGVELVLRACGDMDVELVLRAPKKAY